MPTTGPQIAQPGQPPKPGAAQPTQGAGAQPVAVAQPLTPSFHMDRVPTAAEMSQLPPGTTINTPYGTVGADGRLTPNPETEMRYKEAIVQRRKKFGPHPFASDPNAPQVHVELGKPSFNPFTGVWMKGEM